MIKQLNIFIENKPGRLKAITEVLSKSKLNIWAFTIQDRGDFGLMKLIVDRPRQAHLVLAEKGFACALKDVWAISIPDKPGNLFKLTRVLAKHTINIVDAHVGIASTKEGICFLELAVKDERLLKAVLRKAGFVVLSEEDIYTL
jgi:hypothetical protein